MNLSRNISLFAAIALCLSACSKEGADDLTVEPSPSGSTAPVATPATAAAETPPPAGPVVEKSEPVEVSANAIAVGKMQDGKVVRSPSNVFTTADTVYAGAMVNGQKAGAKVTVYWTYQDGRSHKMETRKLGSTDAQPVSFSFAAADGMKPGKYNVEIDVDMIPIGIADFQVK